MTARRAPKTPPSDMASERPEKPVNDAGIHYVIGAWEPPSIADRALVRDGLTRNGALDLADALGLIDPQIPAGPLSIPCPQCSAAAGSACRNFGSRKPCPTHKARLEAA